jgi:hypothetical protein
VLHRGASYGRGRGKLEGVWERWRTRRLGCLLYGGGEAGSLANREWWPLKSSITRRVRQRAVLGRGDIELSWWGRHGGAQLWPRGGGGVVVGGGRQWEVGLLV